MAIPVSDQSIRQALATVIATKVTTNKVYSWNVLRTTNPTDIRKTITEWLPQFQYNNAGTLITHGWVIKRVERTSEGRAGGCSDFFSAYDVWGFFGYYSTNENSNSENDFNVIVDTLADAFPADSHFQIGTKTLVSSGLQFPVISLLFGSEEMVHFAGGRIEFQLND